MNAEKIFSTAVLNKEASKRASGMSLGFDLSKMIRMGFNEHPYGMSPKALEALQEKDTSSNLYGDFLNGELKQTIAEYYGLKVENVTVGSGSSSLIEVMGTAFLNPGDEVLMCPTFAAFLDMADIRGAKPVVVPLTDDMTYDLDGLYKAITKKTKMIVICNPNNPTGTYLGKKNLIEFIKKVPDDIVILMDEAYLEFATAADCESMYPLITEMSDKAIVVMKTFSKYYGMAGVRVGYALANETLIEGINKCPRTMISRSGQAAAVAAIHDQEYYQSVKKQIADGIAYLQNEMKSLGCTVYPSQTNFILFDPHMCPAELRTEMLKKGIMISATLVGEDLYSRVSVGTEENNVRYIDALKEILAEREQEAS